MSHAPGTHSRRNIRLSMKKKLTKRNEQARWSSGALVRPLRWVEHHITGNGFHGHTATGHHICYVYQPVDMRIKRGPYPWALHSYLGAVEKPIRLPGKTGEERRFKSAKLAKAAAQRWWAREVRALLHGPNAKLSDAAPAPRPLDASSPLAP